MLSVVWANSQNASTPKMMPNSSLSPPRNGAGVEFIKADIQISYLADTAVREIVSLLNRSRVRTTLAHLLFRTGGSGPTVDTTNATGAFEIHFFPSEERSDPIAL